jgi:acetyl-CoA synthetase
MKIDERRAELVNRLLELGPQDDLPVRWASIVAELRQQAGGPDLYREAWQACFADWDEAVKGPPPVWFPSSAIPTESNAGKWMHELGHKRFADFHRWTVENRPEFWRQAIEKLGIVFSRPPTEILDESQGTAKAAWFTDAQLNIVDSCFQAPEEEIAIVAQNPAGAIRQVTYGQLRRQANRVSNSLVDAGCKFGDAIAVVLPMTAWSVPIYLGIVQAGCVVVSIADSFAPPEIASRLQISGAKLVFTYDCQVRAGKKIPLFQRVAAASEVKAVVLSAGEILDVDLREQDLDWDEFLVDRDQFKPIQVTAQETINVLFSSGTTGDPKAIPWNHLTPIKCAIDGYCHQDIRPRQVCAWPTNLGWMMGPWLIFASLINKATIGLYEDAPMGEGFGRFIQDAQVNMLGVVPTIVKSWRATGEMEAFDWSAIHVFSSTGESSQCDDMVYLSSLAGIKPIIEYCGGTEVGGGYVTSSVLEPNVPAAFNTAAVGMDFILVNEENEVADEGEVFLVPPSIGLSSRLVNRDHFATYYEGTPTIAGYDQLRRHGDHIRKLPGGCFVAGGRVDDTMNLGGIKISSAEIERVLNQVAGVNETAAVASSQAGGPDELTVFVVGGVELNPDATKAEMNRRLKEQLNPLFKIRQVKIADSLPRTVSGKIMRRKLREHMGG